MDNPKISVIVPVYNVEQYLPRCIDSILAQTFTDFELLLIDDGSTDNSGKICDKYAEKDNRIRVFHKENGGVSSARNLGLKECTAQWIAFIDSDDYIEANYLSYFIKYNNADDIYTQIIQGFHVFADKNQIIQEIKYDNVEIIIGKQSDYLEKKDLLHRWEVWGRIFSSEIIRKNKILFNESLRLCEDAVFWHTYICKLKKIVYIKSNGYFYYKPINYNSLSSTYKYSVSDRIELTKIYQNMSLELIRKFSLNDEYSRIVYGWYIDRYWRMIRDCKFSKAQIKQVSQLQPIDYLFKKSFRDYFLSIININSSLRIR